MPKSGIMDLSWDSVPDRRSAAHSAVGALANRIPLPASTRSAIVVLNAVEQTIREWAISLPFDHRQPQLGSWLLCVGQGVGCHICKSFKPEGLKLTNLQRHARSREHCEGVDAHLGRPSKPRDCAPPAAAFEAVLADRQRGVAYRQTARHTAGAEKAMQITWCLAEALKDIDRIALLGSQSIAIHQDMRGSLLCIRFCCAGGFQVRRGILGMASEFGTSAPEIRTATLDIVTRACTPRSQPPRRSQGPRQTPIVDAVLFAHVCATIEIFDADGASDEQKAGRMLAGKAGLPAAFPNVKAVMRDRTHAATRSGAQIFNQTNCKREWLSSNPQTHKLLARKLNYSGGEG